MNTEFALSDQWRKFEGDRGESMTEEVRKKFEEHVLRTKPGTIRRDFVLVDGAYRFPDLNAELAAFAAAYQLGVEAAHEENDKEMADWVCPCCSWPNCGHEHPTDVKRILQRAIRNLKG